jgi:hypothetical protein
MVELQKKQRRKLPPPALNLDLSKQGVHFDFVSQSLLDVHSTYVGRYSNQYVFGFHHLHALVSHDGEFNCQEIENYTGRLRHYLSSLPPSEFIVPDIRSSGDGFNVSFGRLTDEGITKLDGPVFFGSPIEPANWGMWLLNGLPNAHAFVAGGQVGHYLCYAPSAWQKNLLQFMGVAPEKLIEQSPWHTYDCREVALHQYSMIDLVPDETARSIFRNIIGRCNMLGQAPSPAKIFISRRTVTLQSGRNYRALENEDQLIDALIQLGFVVIEPEVLPFEEQVRIFNGARFIVGLGGAAMFNAVFAAPGTNLISIESTSVFALSHGRLFASLGLNYGFIFGEQDQAGGKYPHNPWTIDVPGVVEAISHFG